MRGSVALSFAFAPLLVACGGAGAHSRAAGAVGPMNVAPVAWNPSSAPVGNVRAVAESGDALAVFSDAGATIFASKAVVASDHSVTDWVDAETLPATDGSGQWIVGVTGSGHLYRVRNLAGFEDVTARYGLGSFGVREASVLGPSFVGFLLNGEIAIADGRALTRYGSVALTGLVGGGGLAVGVAHDALYVISTAQKTTSSFELPGVTGAAVGASGRIFAATPRAVYAANDRGELALLYEADDDTIHGLVASGERAWFADGAELGAIDGDKVAETSGVKVATDAKLASSPTGDVWVIGGGALQRFSRADAAPSPVAAWTTSISPIFARACASCHLPSGVSGTDLSTAAAWQSEKAKIHDRVVVTKTMPPQGHTISDADREAIRAWTEGGAPAP